MSIIHDALKKAQQGLNPKKNEPANPPAGETSPAYIYSSEPALVETLPSSPEKSVTPQSIGTLVFCIVIVGISGWYIFKQFQNDIPKARNFVRQSFYRAIYKKEPPPFQAKSPQNLKPLAQLTIVPTGGAATKNPAFTLNVHGIMSGANGNLALINDQVYQEGDEIDGAKILKIDLNSITVNVNGIPKTIFVKS